MNAQKYFADIVLPTYKEFERDRQDIRRALLASLVLYHLVDYANADSEGNKGNLGALRKKISECCEPFRVVEAIANGTKHVEVRGPDRFSPDDIVAASGGTTIDRQRLDEGTIREFKAERPMLWVEIKKQRHFIDVDLFVTLNYLADEFRLDGADAIELPMQLVYKDTLG